MKADISGCSSNQGLMWYSCVYISHVCMYRHIQVHAQGGGVGKTRGYWGKKIGFHMQMLHKYTRIGNEKRTNLSSLQKNDLYPFPSLQSMLSLTLDYWIIPTLYFSKDILVKSYVLFNLQVNFDVFSPGASWNPCHCSYTTGSTGSWAGWHLLPWLNPKPRLIKWLIYFSFLSSPPPVSPMSHGWPSTRTKYLTEENCLPTAASVSLASSADSWVLVLEFSLPGALWGSAISGLSSS